MSEIADSLLALDPLSFAQHLDRAPEASLIVDDRGVILWANCAAIELFGYDDDALTGREPDS
jgi:PAS domain S-box-containing protein